MCTISHHAIMPVLVINLVHVFKLRTFARNSVIAVVIARIGSLDAVARLSVIRSSARAIWRYVNVILICVRRAERISSS